MARRINPKCGDPRFVFPRGSSEAAYVRCPDSLASMASTRGYLIFSRYVMARKLGRPLREDEVVVRLDGDIHNDHPSNLRVIRRGDDIEIDDLL